MTSDPVATPTPYTVSYSQRVRDELRALLETAADAWLGKPFLQAAKEIEMRLRIYPQFGDPILDLTHEKGQIRIGTVGPLVVRYAVFEEQRLVMVAVPLMVLPQSGLGETD